MTRRIAAILSLDAAGYTARLSADAAGTLADLNRVFRDTVRPAVRNNDGRVVKLMGDGALAEFPSAAGALLAAAAILDGLKDDPVRLRAGVHVGDVAAEAGDIFGEAVAIAARLQAAAPVGGAYVSRTALDLAGGGLPLSFRAVGRLRLKGVSAPVEVMALDPSARQRDAAAMRLAASQDVRFAASADGVRIAWTAIGEGPPLVKAPNFVQSLDGDLYTVLGGYLADLAARRRLIRFDQRGNGLSDRWPEELSPERFADDLEAVFYAAGLDRAPVIGLSQGCPTAAVFAARRPERVSGLIFIGGFARGYARRDQPRNAETLAALEAMARVGWDDAYPSVRDHFANLVMPDATPDDRLDLAAHMRAAIDGDEFERFRHAVARIDVTETLPEVRCPTLVLHGTGDRQQPISQGRALAAGIPGARFVALDTRNHVMPAYDPAWAVALAEIDAFLAALDGAPA